MDKLCALQVRTAYGVLPADHPKRTDAQLDSAVAMLEQGSPSGCAENILKPMMEQNEQVCYGHTSDMSHKATLPATGPMWLQRLPAILLLIASTTCCYAWAMQVLFLSRAIELSMTRHTLLESCFVNHAVCHLCSHVADQAVTYLCLKAR